MTWTVRLIASGLAAIFALSPMAAQPQGTETDALLEQLDAELFGQIEAPPPVDELARIEERARLRVEFQDVREDCREERDRIRALFRAERDPLERERLAAEHDALLASCRAELASLRADFRALDAQQVTVRTRDPLFQRLVAVVEARVVMEDRLEDLREACERLRLELEGDRLAALERECATRERRLLAQLQLLDQERALLERRDLSSLLLLQSFDETRREQLRLVDRVAQVERAIALIEERCEGAVGARADACAARLAELEGRRAALQARADSLLGIGARA